MAEWLALVLVALALYLLECLVWVDAAASACIRTPRGLRWEGIQGASLPGNERGGLAMMNPAVPGSVVVCRAWPLSISPDGITSLALEGEPGSHDRSVYTPFDEVKSVRAELGDVVVNGVRFVRAGSSAFGTYLAEQIRRIQAREPDARAAEIAAVLHDAFDERIAGKAWRRLTQRARTLRAAGVGLLVFLFGVSPLVLVVFGPGASWPYLLGGVYLITGGIVAAFVRSHAALYPACGYDRWMHVLSMVLLPVSAVRCADKLSRDALCRFSPAVVLPLVCGAESAVPILREQLIDLRVAAQGSSLPGTPASPAVQCAEWFSRQRLAHTEAAVQRQRIPVLQPPVREQETSSYCLRCHAQYRHGSTGAPSACCGAPLTAFPATAAS